MNSSTSTSSTQAVRFRVPLRDGGTGTFDNAADTALAVVAHQSGLYRGTFTVADADRLARIAADQDGPVRQVVRVGTTPSGGSITIVVTAQRVTPTPPPTDQQRRDDLVALGNALHAGRVDGTCPLCSSDVRADQSRVQLAPVDDQRGHLFHVDCVERDGVQLAHAAARAYAIGCDTADAAASWTIDGATANELAWRILRLLNDGDPAADDYLPARPDLSGQWADDATPQSLALELLGPGSDLDSDDVVTMLADAWERGVEDTFQAACERQLIDYVGADR
jgi:hypothetical protein